MTFRSLSRQHLKKTIALSVGGGYSLPPNGESMSDDSIQILPDYPRRYAELVRFLLDQEAAGTLTADETAGLLNVDNDLYRKYLARRRGERADVSPLRAAHAVEEIQYWVERSHPELATAVKRITGRSVATGDEIMRFLRLATFLDERVAAGQLTSEDHRALVGIDPTLHDQYLSWERDEGSHISNSRAGITAEAIERALRARHPELARAYDEDTRGRSR
jgi:hypothetical protein